VTCVAAPVQPRSRPGALAGRAARQRQRPPSKIQITRQLPVASGTGTKRPASSPPSNRSYLQSRFRPSSTAVTQPTAGSGRPSPRCSAIPQSSCPPLVVRRRLKTSGDAAPSSAVSRASRIPSPSRQITRSSWRTVAAMDVTEHGLPVDTGARTPRSDRTMDMEVPGGGGSGLVLKVGRQGRERGEFINPQGICYSDDDGGLVLVADSNCACVQVTTSVVCVSIETSKRLADNRQTIYVLFNRFSESLNRYGNFHGMIVAFFRHPCPLQ